MKPNVTIRITCPAGADVDPQKYEGQTIHLVASVFEESFQMFNDSGLAQIEKLGLVLPDHILVAFRSMINSDHSNRIEILQGITSYACYRRPRSEQQPDDLRTPDLTVDPDDGDKVMEVSQQVSKVCFEDCPGKGYAQQQNGGPDIKLPCYDCPIADVKQPDTFSNANPHASTCNACPHQRKCRYYNRCLSFHPLSESEILHDKNLQGPPGSIFKY